MKNYNQQVTIKTNADKTFKALTEAIPQWWGAVDRPYAKIGDQFKVSFGEAFWTFEITALQHNQSISWLCIESNQVHAGLKGIKKEWLGTSLHWDIKKLTDDTVEVNFLHKGLVPDFNCYDVCATAWDFFITDSLKSLLEKGQGKPQS